MFGVKRLKVFVGVVIGLEAVGLFCNFSTFLSRVLKDQEATKADDLSINGAGLLSERQLLVNL